MSLSKRAKLIIGGIVLVLVLVGLGIGIYFAVAPTGDNNGSDVSPLNPPDPNSPLPPSESVTGVYWDGAVVTNGPLCAVIGRNILMKGGNAVEAAIAALFCEGVVCLQSMGLGGGFLMTIYQKSTGRVTTLNAREVAPLAAHEDMFGGDSNASQRGGLAVAVPGELKGYAEAFKRFKSGNVAWDDLIRPTIELCRQGNPVTPYLSRILNLKEADILATDSMKEILINPATNKVWQVGDRIVRNKLADSLEAIALDDDALYTGSLAQDFVDDLEALGGIITLQDMQNYQVVWADPVVANLAGGYNMYSIPPPGSGVLLAFMLNILKDFVPADTDVKTTHRIIESFKYGYGRRTELADPAFENITELIANLTSASYAADIRSLIWDDRTYQNPEHYGAVLSVPEDHGTAHISVISPNGDAVSVTSTVNLYFGAMIRSTKTGIIYNDEMDDFSAPNITNGFGIPPSPANFIKPGKRPLSSMSPAIFVDTNGDVQLVVGGAGGTKITTATALVAMDTLLFNKTIKEAVDAGRIHHQLFPMNIQYEYGLLYPVVKGLSQIGHNITRQVSPDTSVTAIRRVGQMLHANADYRRSGTVAGY